MAGRKQVVIFDHDGTIIDSSLILFDSFMHVSRTFGLSQPKYGCVIKTIGYEDQFSVLFGQRKPEFVDSFLEYYYTHHLSKIRLYLGIEEALATLANRGFSLAIASNKLRKAGLAELEACGVAERFPTTVYREDVTNPKPHPESIEVILSRLGLDHNCAVMVGDTSLDVECARRAGIPAVAVLWGYGRGAELEQYSPSKICASVRDLPNLIAELLETNASGKES